jgi:toxin-antitoxin system PIN domain toxin
LILTDVNVLVYAANRDAEQHREYRAWLSAALGADEPLACSAQTLLSTIRILTHNRVLHRPLTVAQALLFADSIRSAPSVRLVEPGDDHWRLFGSLAKAVGARGNTVMDAWLAALAIENDCTLVTNDRGFARFDGLKWRHPLRA